MFSQALQNVDCPLIQGFTDLATHFPPCPEIANDLIPLSFLGPFAGSGD